MALSADDLEDRRLLVHDPLEAVRLEIASRSGKEEPSRLVLAKNRDQAWEVEEPPKRAKDLDEVSIGALIQNLSQLRYTNKSERQFEGPDVSILFEGDKGRPLAALEIKKIDDGPLLARRPGESQVFEIEELALAGLPEPWAIGKNKN